MIDSWKFIHGHQDSSDFQVFGGDFNAEPLESSLQYLVSSDMYELNQLNQSLVEVEISTSTGEIVLGTPTLDESDKSESGSTCRSELFDLLRSHELQNGPLDHNSNAPCPDFIDTWIASNPMATNYSSRTKQDDNNYYLGYTFPACNPIKRIDYLFARNTTRAKSSLVPTWVGTVVNTRIIGIDPTAESG